MFGWKYGREDKSAFATSSCQKRSTETRRRQIRSPTTVLEHCVFNVQLFGLKLSSASTAPPPCGRGGDSRGAATSTGRVPIIIRSPYVVLEGVDNDTAWRRDLDYEIIEKVWDEHLDHTLPELLETVRNRYPVSEDCPASQQFKQSEILDRTARDHALLRKRLRVSVSPKIFDSLSPTLQCGEPKDIV